MQAFQDIFISYGRRDSLEFASRLNRRLVDRGFTVWFDYDDIPLGVDYQKQIDDGIIRADNFLFIISPHSINSPYCGLELELALKHQKRIIPWLHVEKVSYETWQQRNPKGTATEWADYQAKGWHDHYQNMHPILRQLNWIYGRDGQDDFEVAFAGLLNVCDRHKEYVHHHTLLLVKALEWEQQQKRSPFLLIGEERLQAEVWLKIRFKDSQPPCIPTDLHCEFISESRKNADNLMTEVFLAYTDENRATAAQIRNSLQRVGFTVWTNTTDIQVGAEFQQVIDRGIEEADNIVYLLSPATVSSPWCQHELEYALSLNKRVIPVLVEAIAPNQIPLGIRNLQYIDLTDNRQEIDYRLDESQLLQVLRQDAAYHETRKRLLTKALKWERQRHNPTLLLRGHNLKQAEAWLKLAKQMPAYPVLPLQEAFIEESLHQPPGISLDVFISYSRTDSDFARRLNEALQTQGKTTWFDQESIASGSDFQQEIYRGIEASNSFVFVLSPSSVNSPYCADEVDKALKLNKRIVPVLYRSIDTTTLHPGLAQVQWIDFNQHQGDFYANFGELIRTLDTDLDHLRSHTRLLIKAMEWEREGREPSFLLRGKDLQASEQWLQMAATKQPSPTQLQQDYITTSRKAPYRKPKLAIALLASLFASAIVVGVRSLGVMQPLELATYDLTLRSRPSEAQDDRILIIEIGEADIPALNKIYPKGKGTLPDGALVALLQKLQPAQPRLIAYDLYRDFPAEPPLVPLLRNNDRFIGICNFGQQYEGEQIPQQQLPDEQELEPGIAPPLEIPSTRYRDRIGFNNSIIDADGTIRRYLAIHVPDPEFCPTDSAFSWTIARRYLEAQEAQGKLNITTTSSLTQNRPMQLGDIRFNRLSRFAGGYQNEAETWGYQTLLNYRAYKGFPGDFAPRVSIRQVLADQVPLESIKDRLVFIGLTAVSSRDTVSTPYGRGLDQQVSGVIIHAQMTSQMISAVLDNRPLIWWWPWWGDTLWIATWSAMGGLIIWRFQTLHQLLGVSGGALLCLVAICYVVLSGSAGWLPLLPAAIALLTTVGFVILLPYKWRR